MDAFNIDLAMDAGVMAEFTKGLQTVERSSFHLKPRRTLPSVTSMMGFKATNN